MKITMNLDDDDVTSIVAESLKDFREFGELNEDEKEAIRIVHNFYVVEEDRI